MIHFNLWIAAVQEQLADVCTDRVVDAKPVDIRRINRIAEVEQITYDMDEQAWLHNRQWRSSW